MLLDRYFECDKCGREALSEYPDGSGMAYVAPGKFRCLPGHGCKSEWGQDEGPLPRGYVTQEQVDNVFESLYAYIHGHFAGTRPGTGESFVRFAKALRESLE
jgi:hypothetical protein